MGDKCKFVITRGVNKGKECGKSCRDSYCFEHKPKRLEKRKETNKKQYLNEKKENIIKNISENSNEELQKIQLKLKSKEDDLNLILRKYHGVLCYINPGHQVPIRPKIKRKIESEEYINECKELYNELDESSQKHFGTFNKYLEYSREKELTYPNTYIKIIPYTGTAKRTHKYLNELEHEYSNKLKEIKIMRDYIREIEITLIQKTK